MKKNDIKVGEHYAVGQNLQHKGTTAYRYMALAVGVERRRFSPSKRGWGTPTPTTDGVLMERVNENGHTTGVREVIRSADIYKLWEEYEDMRLVRDEDEITRAAKDKAEAENIRRRINAMIPLENQTEKVAKFYAPITTPDRRYYTSTITMGGQEFVELLDQIAELSR